MATLYNLFKKNITRKMSQINQFVFHPTLKCSQHPIFSNDFKNSMQATEITYEAGPQNYPVIRCQSITSQYIEVEEKCDSLLKKLSEHGNDFFRYREHLLTSKNMRGNNRNKNCKQLNDLEFNFEWIESEGKKVLKPQNYFCHNKTICKPIKPLELTNQKPKLSFENKMVAVPTSFQFIKRLLLKQQNNFRATIQEDFGKGSFSKYYYFSDELSKKKIHVKGMAKPSKTRNEEFKKLLEFHDRLPLRIGKSTIPNAGKGVFAMQNFPKDMMLMFYVGEQRNCWENWPPSDSVYDLGFIEKTDIDGPQSKRLFPIVVEPLKKLNAGRYINTNPGHNNLRMEKVIVDGVIGLLLVTNAQIIAGDQLFYPYGSNYGFSKQFLQNKNPKGGELSQKQLDPKVKRMIKQQEKDWMKQTPIIEKSGMEEQKPEMEAIIEEIPENEEIPQMKEIPEMEVIVEEISMKEEKEEIIREIEGMSNEVIIEEITEKQEIPGNYKIMEQKEEISEMDVEVQEIKEKPKQQKQTSDKRYVNQIIEKLRNVGSAELNPSQKLSKLYRTYSRIKYNKFKHMHPRMRQAEVIQKIIKTWSNLSIDEKVLLYKEYLDNKNLRECDSDIDSQQSDSESQKQDHKGQYRQTPAKSVKTQGVRVFIEEDDVQQKQKSIHHLESDESSELEIEVQRKRNPASEYIPISDLMSYIRRKIKQSLPPQVHGKLTTQITQATDKKYNQLFEVFYGDIFYDVTQRQHIQQYRKCVICNKKTEFSRLGNHLNKQHKDQKQMVIFYQRMIFKKDFWAKIEYDAQSIQFFEKWRFLDCNRKRTWFNKNKNELLLGRGLDELPIDRKLMLLRVRYVEQRRIIKVEITRTGRQRFDPKPLLKPSEQPIKQPVKLDIIGIADFVFRTGSVFDDKMRPLSKQTFIASYYVKNPITMYLRRGNGRYIKIGNRQLFQRRKSSRKNLGKGRVSGNNIKNRIEEMHIEQKSEEIDIVDMGKFECPICNKEIPKGKQYHIASCLKYTTLCNHCDSRHNVMEPHVCFKSNNTIKCNGINLSVKKHVELVIEEQRKAIQKKPELKPKDVLQDDRQISPSEIQHVNYDTENAELRMMHLERNARMKDSQIEDFNHLLLNLYPEPFGKLDYMRNKIQCIQKKDVSIKIPEKITRREAIFLNMKELLRRLSQPHMTTSKTYPSQFEICKAVLKYKIERHEWIQAHDTCAICLSEMSPHIKHMVPKLVDQLIQRPHDIIAMEIQRIKSDMYGKDHRQPEIERESILTYANKIAIRQCSKCTKIYHRACWDNHQNLNGNQNVRCPNCRAVESVGEPKTTLLNGEESDIVDLIDFREMKTILKRLGIIRE